MASCITPQFGSNKCPQVRLTVTQTSSTATQVTLSWELEYVAHGYAVSTSNSKSYTAVVAGSTVASGSYAINGKTGTSTIASGTKTINKTTSNQTISFSCSMSFNITWSGTYGGTKSASGSISVPAKTSYTISYNANGGSGAPSPQTKWAETNISLSNTKPTRTGYSFLGWSSSSTATTASYAAGATYSSNASVTLYAVWKANTYTISYNANGGSGAPSPQTKTYGKTLTLSNTKPTRANYSFKGWGKSSSSTTVSYAAGSSYTSNTSATLYAVWELAYTKPKISNLSVSRCNSSGTIVDNGTYAIVSFSWSTFIAVSSITIEWAIEGSTTWTSRTVAATGTNGTVTTTPIGGAFNADTSYSFRITVADNTDSSDRYISMSAQEFVIDVLNQGKGLSIGKAAEEITDVNGSVIKAFDVKWRSKFRDHVVIGDKIGHLDGKQGILLSNEGYIHLQRTTAQGYNPYIAFMLDDEKAVTAQIRYNVSNKALELRGAESYLINGHADVQEVVSTYSDTGFRHEHPGTGNIISFGVGSGGTNRGIYDSTLGRWLFKTNGTDTTIGSSQGEFKPYFSAGDSFTVLYEGAGFVTNSGTDLYFSLGLAKPVLGSPVRTITSVDGFVVRQNNKYCYGSAAGVYVKPTSYNCRFEGNNGSLRIMATFNNSTNIVNNSPVGILASVKVTFS